MPITTIVSNDEPGTAVAQEGLPASTNARGVSQHYSELPRYVPMPSGVETEKFSGLKRSKINQLILPCTLNGFRPPVRSISLKPPGALKGKRLIVLSSLLEYLAKLEAQQIGGADDCK